MIFLVLLMFCRVLFLLSIILPLPEELPLMYILVPGNKQWSLHFFFFFLGKIQIMSSFLNDIFTGWNSGFYKYFFPNTLKGPFTILQLSQILETSQLQLFTLVSVYEVAFKKILSAFCIFSLFFGWQQFEYDMFRHEVIFFFSLFGWIEFIPLDGF